MDRRTRLGLTARDLFAKTSHVRAAASRVRGRLDDGPYLDRRARVSLKNRIERSCPTACLVRAERMQG